MVLESSPPNIGMTVQMEQSSVILSPVLLNEKDRVFLSFIVSGMPTDGGARPFNVEARIAGLKEIEIMSAIEESETAKGTSAVFGYWAGFVAGIVMAGILGFVSQQLRFHRKRMEALGRPQVVTTKTDKTPGQVLQDSVAGGCSRVFWAVVLIAVLVGVIWLAFQSLS